MHLRCHFTYVVEAKEWAIPVDARFNFQILVKSNFFAKYFKRRQWPPPCCLQRITPYFYTHLSFLKGIFLTIIFLSSLSIPIFLDRVSWWASKAYKAIRLNHHCLNNSFFFFFWPTRSDIRYCLFHDARPIKVCIWI